MVTIYQEAEVVAEEKNVLKATNTLLSIRSSLKKIATCLDVRKLTEYRLSVDMQKKRKIFQGFDRYYWVNCRINAMLAKRNKRLLVTMIMHWQLYTSWCHRYHRLHNRSIQSIKRICLYKLHDYIKEHHETRVWKTSINRILMKKYFKDLKTFTNLSKHELKNRLKKGSTLTLDDKNLLRYTYDRWSRRIKVFLSFFFLLLLIIISLT